MKKEYSTPSLFILSVVAAFFVGWISKSDTRTFFTEPETVDERSSARENAETGKAALYGKIEEISLGEVRLRLVEWTTADTAERAALESGKCSLKKIEDNECLPNGFFVRETQKSLVLSISPRAEVIVQARGAAGDMIGDDSSSRELPVDVAELIRRLAEIDYMKDIPFSLTTTNGVVTQIQELYVP